MRFNFAIFALLLNLSAVLQAQNLEIALTFDDAPRQDTVYYTGVQRTNKLVSELAAKNVIQAGFFCNTRDFSSNDAARLQKYADAGHIIANHSAHHLDYHAVGFDVFAADIEEAHSKLFGYMTYLKLFRFPYLRQGQSLNARNLVNAYLAKENYKHAYVTVETYDWELDRLFQSDLASARKVDLDKLRSVYLKILWEGILFYEQLALRVMGRSPRHVILLHENDINALFIGDLIDRILAVGGKIITLEDAYRDPISAPTLDHLPFSQRRIRAIAKDANYQGPTVSSWEDEEAIAKLYQELVKGKLD